MEAELKAEPALQPLFDSHALESLPQMETQIQELTGVLRRNLDAALQAASNYEKITLNIAGGVQDSVFVSGEHYQVKVSKVYNYYYSGLFATLNDYYIPPDAVFQRVRVDEFVGRDWLTAKVDAFLDEPRRKSGAFLLHGEAGVGKTSFMAHLVEERKYLHLFAEQVPGDANVQRALQSLVSGETDLGRWRLCVHPRDGSPAFRLNPGDCEALGRGQRISSVTASLGH